MVIESVKPKKPAGKEKRPALFDGDYEEDAPWMLKKGVSLSLPRSEEEVMK